MHAGGPSYVDNDRLHAYIDSRLHPRPKGVTYLDLSVAPSLRGWRLTASPQIDAVMSAGEPPPRRRRREPVIATGILHPRPRDHSCLYHSLGYGLAMDGRALKTQIFDWLSQHADEPVDAGGEETWAEWVRLLSMRDKSGRSTQAYSSSANGLSVRQYVASMRKHNAWGGEMEMAVCARCMHVEVWVFRHLEGDRYERTSVKGDSSATHISIVGKLDALGNIAHYDALELTGDD